jgi:hypothetical protein
MRGGNHMKGALLVVLVIGVILFVVGFDKGKGGLVDAGAILTTLSLFTGSLFLEDQGNLRLGMAIAAGIVLASVARSLF